MAKYMLIGSYTAEGAKGLLKEGGTSRRDAAAKAIASAGGTLETFYLGFGTDDYYVTVDFPNHASAAAAALTVGASGTSKLRTVVLLMPEEIDAAAKLTVDFRPPGA
ncbi:MAG TPA: GYD domain-containing protein [Candidatus Limnocylindria bacterium]